MPLSPPVTREPIQTRRMECACFRRADGLWDVEGHLTDVAAYDFPNYYRGMIHAGEPIHDMWIRLTLDETVEIRAVEVRMDGVPYGGCPAIEPAFQKLKGLRIGPGWNRKVRELLGGAKGCVHVVDLLRPGATVGFKTVKREAASRDRAAAERTGDSPYQIDSCHMLASDGALVRERWPDRYTGPDRTSPGTAG
jgi:hypothetical protein